MTTTCCPKVYKLYETKLADYKLKIRSSKHKLFFFFSRTIATEFSSAHFILTEKYVNFNSNRLEEIIVKNYVRYAPSIDFLFNVYKVQHFPVQHLALAVTAS